MKEMFVIKVHNEFFFFQAQTFSFVSDSCFSSKGFLCMTVLKTLESKKLSIETSRIILVSSIWQLPLLLSGIVFFLTFPQMTKVTEVNLTL